MGKVSLVLVLVTASWLLGQPAIAWSQRARSARGRALA